VVVTAARRAAPVAATVVRGLAVAGADLVSAAGGGIVISLIPSPLNANESDDLKRAQDSVKAGKTSLGSAASTPPPDDDDPRMGKNKSEAKWAKQMAQRGWTKEQIKQAIANGDRYSATNNVNPGNGATRYVNPDTGQSVVVDNTTGEVLHVGGPGFRY